jgi:large repetitive protein
LGAGTLSGLTNPGTATFPTSSLPPGPHTINANYNGDTNSAPSTGSTTVTINPAATTTTVVTTPNPAAFGAPVTTYGATNRS